MTREKKLGFIMLTTGIALALFGFLPNSLNQREPATVTEVAAEMTAGYDSTVEKSMAVFRYMMRNFQYDSELRGTVLSKEVIMRTPDSQQTLNDRKGGAVTCGAVRRHAGKPRN